MIFDNLKNVSKYMNLSPSINKAFEYLLNLKTESINEGKYIIDGDNMYSVCMEYETKESSKWEAHNKYIDIQFIISGTERMFVSEKSFMSEKTEYDSEKDIQFYDGEAMVSICAYENDFAVFFPDDIHMPGIINHNPDKVKKVVVKIHV